MAIAAIQQMPLANARVGELTGNLIISGLALYALSNIPTGSAMVSDCKTVCQEIKETVAHALCFAGCVIANLGKETTMKMLCTGQKINS